MPLPSFLRSFLAWILCVRRPLPTWSEPERLEYQRRHLKHNVLVNVTEGAFWWVGMGFAPAATVMPLFISKLTTSAWPLGLLGALANAGWLLPQLFTSNFVERLAQKKPIVVYLGALTERLPVIFFPLAALLAPRHPQWALALFLTAYAWHKLGSGIIATAWQDMLANCFPLNVRSWLLAGMVVIGAGIALACAEPCARLLESLAFPYNFVVCFGVCAFGVLMSGVILVFTREPVDPVLKPRQSHREFARELPQHLRTDRSLRNALAARVLATCGMMSVAFLTVSAVQRWDLPDRSAAMFTGWMMAGQMLGNLACATISSRTGHKLTLGLGWLLSAAAFIIAAMAPSPTWIYPVFLLVGMTSGFDFISAMLLVMELAQPERRATYTGLVNTSVGVVGLFSPLVGSVLVAWSPSALMSLSAVFYLLAALTLWRGVDEPRRRLERQAFRAPGAAAEQEDGAEGEPVEREREHE